MSRSTRFFTFCILATLLSVVSSACGGGDDPGLVTTTSRVVTTTAPTTTTAPELETSTTAAPEDTTGEAEETTDGAAVDTEADPQEEIDYAVVRLEQTRDGDRLFLEIPPGDYTDVDLRNLVESVREAEEGLYELHVFDNREAVEALLKTEEERTSEEVELLDRHYLVSLFESNILRYQGPFANLEGFIIGS